MTRLAPAAVLLAALPALAAPIPKQSGPSLAGKYTLLGTSTSPTGKGGFGGDRGPGGGGPGGFAPADDDRGFRTSSLLAGRTTTITADRITIDGRTAAWEYRLDADAKPPTIDITITPVRGKPTRHLGVVEFDRDRVTIAYAADGQERPKSVDDAKGVTVYVFQRVPPPPRMEYRIIPVVTGKEEDTEREVNRLAGEGFEVVFATSGSGSHLVLRRQKP